MKSVYIETSIPSFFYAARQEPEMVARKNWTHKWWNQYRTQYELFTSDGVIAELSEGEYPSQADAIKLMDGILRLEAIDESAC